MDTIAKESKPRTVTVALFQLAKAIAIISTMPITTGNPRRRASKVDKRSSTAHQEL